VTLEDRLRAIASNLPEGSALVLSAAALESLLDPQPVSEGRCPQDMTVKEVAKTLKRSAQSVRRLIRSGELDAYLFRGREYRVTRAALDAFIGAERRGGSQIPRIKCGAGRADLGAWRRLRSQR
jgi:excisionase family DNA binding protein